MIVPKRKRHRGGSAAPAEEPDVELAVRLFAERQREEEQARRAAKREAKAARAAAQQRDALVRAKDGAAEKLKAVRGSGAGGEAVAAAAADYRAALDAVLADEAGTSHPSEPDGSEPDVEAEPSTDADEPGDAGG